MKPSPPPPGPRRKLLGPILLGLACALALIELIGLIDGAPAVDPLQFWVAPWKPFLNALPFLLLAVVFAALTRRQFLAACLALAVAGATYAANALKLRHLATPLMPADFRMLGQLGGGGDLLASYLPQTPLAALGLVGALALLLVLAWREPPSIPRRPWPRAITGGAAALLLGSLVLAVPAWSSVYRPGLGLQPWSARNTARSTGLVTMLNLFHLRYSTARPEPDPARARALLADYAPALRAVAARGVAEQLPDIVVVQSESFIDPGILAGYPTDAFIPELARLRRRGLHGRMHVPTFGGGTIRTEFEFLTGISLRYYPGVQFPYLEFDQPAIPSLARTLARHGYATVAVHPNRPEFWNRTSAMRALGFERFVALADFGTEVRHEGRYVADAEFTDAILRELPADGPPRFVFGISIEAHGPYDVDADLDPAERAAMPVPAGVDPYWTRQLQNFLYHARHADAELGRLADALAARERPTLLFFFGDHLPALVPVFEAAGFDDGGTFFTQTVPWLLRSTGGDAGREEASLAAWSAPALLLAQAGIHDDPWFNLVGLVGPRLAGLTRAPDAPPADPGTRAELDRAMAEATRLHLRGELEFPPERGPTATAGSATMAVFPAPEASP